MCILCLCVILIRFVIPLYSCNLSSFKTCLNAFLVENKIRLSAFLIFRRGVGEIHLKEENSFRNSNSLAVT